MNRAHIEKQLICNICKEFVKCKCKDLTCPFLPRGECRWHGKLNKLYYHYQSEHDRFLFHEYEFEVQLKKRMEANYLRKIDNDLFVLHITGTEINNDKFYTNLTLLNNSSTTITYDVFIYSEEDLIYNNLKLNRNYAFNYKNEYHEIMLMKVVINYKELFTAEEKVDKIIDEDTVDKSITETPLIDFNETEPIVPNNEFSSSLLKSIECPFCFNIMLPPVRQCDTGHSFCNNCAPKITQCGICRSGISNARNYTLEAMINDCVKKCKNNQNGCEYITTKDAMMKHEYSCEFGQCSCPLAEYLNCKWRNDYDLRLEHVSLEHSDHFLQEKSLTFNYNNEKGEDCYIVTLDDKIFKLCYKYEDEILYIVIVLDSNEIEEYNYKILFSSEELLGEEVLLRGNCPINRAKSELFKEKGYAKTTIFMIRPLMKDDLITFFYNINKV